MSKIFLCASFPSYGTYGSNADNSKTALRSDQVLPNVSEQQEYFDSGASAWNEGETKACELHAEKLFCSNEEKRTNQPTLRGL